MTPTMYLATIAVVVILLIAIFKNSVRPPNFPPGPPRYPLIGSANYIVPPNGNKPNIFWGVRHLQKQYGSIFGLYLGSIR